MPILLGPDEEIKKRNRGRLGSQKRSAEGGRASSGEVAERHLELDKTWIC